MGAHAERMAGYGKRNRRNRDGYPFVLTIEPSDSMRQQWERQQDTAAVKLFNNKVRAWGKQVQADLYNSIEKRITDKKDLKESLGMKYRHWGRTPQAGQEITSIGFYFNAPGLYVHIGVGRGYSMENGTVVSTKKHNRDDFRRFPKPWFDPIVEKHIPDLEQIVANYCKDLAMDLGRMFIWRNWDHNFIII